jgi:hypothetical protein
LSYLSLMYQKTFMYYNICLSYLSLMYHNIRFLNLCVYVCITNLTFFNRHHNLFFINLYVHNVSQSISASVCLSKFTFLYFYSINKISYSDSLIMDQGGCRETSHCCYICTILIYGSYGLGVSIIYRICLDLCLITY